MNCRGWVAKERRWGEGFASGGSWRAGGIGFWFLRIGASSISGGFRHSTVTYDPTHRADYQGFCVNRILQAAPVMRAAIYARVSTLDQHVENQLQELRTYCERRGWSATEFIDHGVSGAKERRPALDEMLKAAKRRKFDVLIVWRLDRLGRNLRHLILLLDELHALGVLANVQMRPRPNV